MKTTVDISDELLKKAKRLAAKRRTTLRAIIEQGLRNTIKEQQRGAKYVLPDMSIDGKGLQAEFKNKAWSDIRDAAYEGRGS
ncbi:MAG: type II toxin-antitoxin system VapB family antitoxin [Proteobacteria bacterium]|nr:type II toxin-antitoxin system VapB family antitoxin [Pseudomonadota bacterium]